MLVLTRKQNESIMIGDTIEVKVLEVKENQVRVGVVAPREVTVHRMEVYLAIQRENIEAAKAQAKTEELQKLIKEPAKSK
jgi:carbon storage regulator